jgi:hypothetical protein
MIGSCEPYYLGGSATYTQWVHFFNTTRRSQEALYGFSKESTRTTLVSTRQDLEEQEEASKINHIVLGGLSIYSTPGTPQGREKI